MSEMGSPWQVLTREVTWCITKTSGLGFMKTCLQLLCWRRLLGQRQAWKQGGQRRHDATIHVRVWGEEKQSDPGYIREIQMKMPFYRLKRVEYSPFISFSLII